MKESFYTCDLETTGTNPNTVEMIEFYMSHHQGKTLVGELHLLIQPRIWSAEADASVEFHKIDRENAMKGTPWKDAMAQIWGFLPEEPSYFVCHANRRMFGRQGCFDHQVLSMHFFDAGQEFYKYFQRVFPGPKIISTHSLAKAIMGGPKNGLKDVAHAMGVTLKDHHTAKNDAVACWKIFQKLRSKVNLEQFCQEDYDQILIPEKDDSKKQKKNSIIDDFDVVHTEEGEYAHG